MRLLRSMLVAFATIAPHLGCVSAFQMDYDRGEVKRRMRLQKEAMEAEVQMMTANLASEMPRERDFPVDSEWIQARLQWLRQEFPALERELALEEEASLDKTSPETGMTLRKFLELPTSRQESILYDTAVANMVSVDPAARSVMEEVTKGLVPVGVARIKKEFEILNRKKLVHGLNKKLNASIREPDFAEKMRALRTHLGTDPDLRTTSVATLRDAGFDPAHIYGYLTTRGSETRRRVLETSDFSPLCKSFGFPDLALKDTDETSGSDGLPGWAVALLVVGGIAAVALCVTLIVCCCCKKEDESAENPYAAAYGAEEDPLLSGQGQAHGSYGYAGNGMMHGQQQMYGGQQQMHGGHQQMHGGQQYMYGGRQQMYGGQQQMYGGQQHMVAPSAMYSGHAASMSGAQAPMQNAQAPMQSAQAPMQQNAQAPMQQNAQAPMQQNAQAPMQQNAQAPMQQNAQAPMQSTQAPAECVQAPVA